jgi:hypothetical protein
MDFNFKQKTRQPYVVLLNFTAYELGQKPIKYWRNTGNVNRKSAFHKIINKVKNICGDPTSNTITRLFHYAGADVTFPFHVQWMEDKFEFCLFDCFGSGNNTLKFSRKVNSDNERFTKNELKLMTDFMVTEHHIITGLYNKFRDEFKTSSGHSKVFEIIRKL